MTSGNIYWMWVNSGLDIEGMMNDIDNQDELKKESEDLSKQLQEIHSAIEQQKFLMLRVQRYKDYLNWQRNLY